MTAILIQSKVDARSETVELDLLIGHKRIVQRAQVAGAAIGRGRMEGELHLLDGGHDEILRIERVVGLVGVRR